MSLVINSFLDDVVSAEILQSIVTEKYFERSLDADNNLLEVALDQGTNIISKIDNDDCSFAEIQNAIASRFAKVIISIK